MCKIVLSGYFCTGKTSIMEKLKTEFNLTKPKDFTTRPRRFYEQEGDPYCFITMEKFLELEHMGKLFDPIEHAGNRYAVDYEDLFSKNNWVMDILPDSWQVFKQIPGVIGIYLVAPLNDELRRRATARGDKPDVIESRIRAIKPQNLRSYHYVVDPQSSLDLLYQKIKAIVLQHFIVA